MLTDTALRNFKPKSLIYKASDRDGMYVTVSPTGTVTFRFDYRLNGRRETLTIGRYGPAGISLGMAREKLLDAKKAVAQGKSPAHEKQREKRRLSAAKNFGDMTAQWLAGARMAERRGQRVILARNLLGTLRNRELALAIKDIAAETGLEHRPVADGQRVAGIYRRCVMLASGRYAMLDDGMGFSLVPWKPVIEQRLGQQSAATMRGGRVSWEIGSRGIAIA
ncbi:hypothetical protein GCM10010975_32190 [Comamonas phosphati]|nr:hypothetical protein GCM10010975_32190 [Comamonas phosphati]